MNRRQRRRAEARHQELLDVLEDISIGVGGDQLEYTRHVTDLTRRLEVVSASLADSEANNVRLESRIAVLQSDLDSVEDRRDLLECACNAYEDKIAELEAKAPDDDSLIALSNDLKARVEQAESALVECRLDLNNAELATVNQKALSAKLDADLYRALAEIERLKAAAQKDERLIGQLRFQCEQRGIPASQTHPVMSALAAKHGERIVALDAEFLSPDAIASEINEGLGRNDQINTLQVNRVLLEMQRLGKTGAK